MSLFNDMFGPPVQGGGIPAGATYWMGVTTSALTDGASTNPITINNESVTAEVGGMTGYQGQEFVWDGTQWQALGKTELPSVSALDNGKLLCVVNGAWAAVSPDTVFTDGNEVSY